MGFFTLLLLGALFVAIQGQDVLPNRQDQLRDRTFLSEDQRLMYGRQGSPSLSGQQMTSQRESTVLADKLRQSLDQDQGLYTQQILKNDDLPKNLPLTKNAGVTTVCVQVQNAGHPVVCGPQVSSNPLLIPNAKSPQSDLLDQNKPRPSPPYVQQPIYAPVRTQTQMTGLPLYRYVAARDYLAPKQLALNCQLDRPLNGYTSSYRLSDPLQIPSDYLNLGLNTENRKMSPDSSSFYNWGASPLMRSDSLLMPSDRSLAQSPGMYSNLKLKDVQLQQLPQATSQQRMAETPLMNFYDDSLAKGLENMMRASEGSSSSTGYLPVLPGYERANEKNALERLEKSRENLTKLTRELEEIKKARATEEGSRLEEKSQQSPQQQLPAQQLNDEDRKRLASQEPMRPAQMGDMRQ